LKVFLFGYGVSIIGDNLYHYDNYDLDHDDDHDSDDDILFTTPRSGMKAVSLCVGVALDIAVSCAGITYISTKQKNPVSVVKT
jgi:hypothetical protein